MKLDRRISVVGLSWGAHLLQGVLVAGRDGIGSDAAVRTWQVDSEAGGRGGGDDALAVVRLAHVALDETGGGPATPHLLTVSLGLAQLPRIDRLRGGAPRGDRREVLAVVRIGDGERRRGGCPAGCGVGGAASGAALSVLRRMIAVGDRRGGAAAAMAVVGHGGEYLRCVHGRLDAIRRDELDGARVGAVGQQAAVAVGRRRRCVYATGTVLGRIQAPVALVLDRIHIHHQVSVLTSRRGHQHDL
jgi:hypothetical protein